LRGDPRVVLDDQYRDLWSTHTAKGKRTHLSCGNREN
jgi:hypothetical protein